MKFSLKISFFVNIFTWTINLKSFEIEKGFSYKYKHNAMNYKLEKFWNMPHAHLIENGHIWTINLKSFEIREKINFYQTCLHEL